MNTTKETKHTPTPWTLDDKRRTIHAGGRLIASCWLPREVSDEREPGESWLDMRIRTEPERNTVDAEEKANAAFIVQAVNHHAQLVEALAECEAVVSKNYDHAYATNPLVRQCGALSAIRDIRDNARAILAKVQP